MGFERLFSPVNIGNLTLKNRIIMPAMHHLYTENGFATERFNQYFWKRAEGGAAMVIVGACRFDDYGARLSTMSLRNDDTIESYKLFTDGMHARDCRVAVQLYHAGRYMYKADVPAGGEAIAPSAVYTPYTKETAREMTLMDIKRVVYEWATAAVRAKRAGFDAVEISGSAGYLISQFLSPVSNLRTDAYGGSAENRHRFPLEVVSAVREAVGADYPLILRLGGSDLIPGSCTADDAAYFALKAERAGIDMIDLTGGWHESRIPQLTEELPRGGLAYLAKTVKDSVGIPVAMANRMGDPCVAETAIALGRADVIAMGRQLIADPELPDKLRRGRPGEVRACVACNQGCLANTFFDRPVKCLVNGSAGREYQLSRTKADRPKKLLVAGGGVAGCEFALNAARLGHKVTLWEKTGRLGGQLNTVVQLPFRREFSNIMRYQKEMLEKYCVDVRLGKTATRDEVLAGGYEEVVLAVGRIPKDVSVPRTADSVPVFTAEDVISRRAVMGKNVAVIGGSFVGCETARFLALDGSLSADQLYYMLAHQVEPAEKALKMLGNTERKVHLIDKGKIGTGYESGVAWTVLQDLDRMRVSKYPQTDVINITSAGVVALKTAKDGSSERVCIPCDGVVVAVGSLPDMALYSAIYDKVKTTLLGNVNKLGRAINAIEDAVTLAYAI